jgi:hypothetical protein
MTPREFMQFYRSLTVRLDDNQLVTVDVHQYLINKKTKHHDPKAAHQMWLKISHRIDEQVKHENKEHPPAAGAEHSHVKQAGHPHHGHHKHSGMTRAKLIGAIDASITEGLLAAVSMGKGSPSAIKVYLRLAVRYGFATSEGLQNFVDHYLGIDCSGFVSNYLVAVGRLAPQQVVNTNARSYDVVTSRRRTVEDVKPLDILVWEDHTHVAIIDSMLNPITVVEKVIHKPAHGHGHAHGHTANLSAVEYKSHRENPCNVVESNGSHGLHEDEYGLMSVNSDGVFKVHRENGSVWHVYIIDWGLVS